MQNERVVINAYDLAKPLTLKQQKIKDQDKKINEMAAEIAHNFKVAKKLY